MADDIERIRDELMCLQDELIAQSDRSAEARRPVTLDQQSIGRLSRQDALQQQAMAKAQDARRAIQLRRIKAALARIDDGEFGFCEECGETIAAKRLEIDPSSELCVVCASSTR